MKFAKTLLIELMLFSITQLTGLGAAYFLILKKPELIPFEEISLTYFVVAFLIATFFIILALRFLKGSIGFKLLFVLLIAIGTKTVFQPFTSEIFASLLALGVIILWLLIKYVWVHNLAIILAVAGISAQLGLTISTTTILLVLAALSIYDVFAVYKTQHMVSMFKNLMSKGVILSIISPFSFSGFLRKLSSVELGKEFVLLGTGDLAFPLIFAVAILKFSLRSSLFVVGGALLGATIVFLLLTHQTQHRAIPALPPIAACSVLGFLLSLMI